MSTWQASREEYETHLVHDGQAPRRRIPARHLPLASGRWSCRLGKHRSSSSGQPTFMPTFPPSGTIQDAGSQPQVGLELNPTSSKNIRLCREHSVGVARENHRQERRMVPTSHTNTCYLLRVRRRVATVPRACVQWYTKRKWDDE
jgi:hypothetical protein